MRSDLVPGIVFPTIHLEESCRELSLNRARISRLPAPGFSRSFYVASPGDGTSNCGLPLQAALNRYLRLIRRPIEGGGAATPGFRVTSPAQTRIEHALAESLNEVEPATGVRLRIFVLGKPWALKPAIQDQLFLIAREAVTNALRHSQATRIEVEFQYLRNLLCVLVRDNGCGIGSDVILGARDSYRGLRGMRESAESIGARFGIWSRLGAGTEVRVTVSVDVVVVPD